MKERSESVDNHNLQWSWFLSTNVMPGTTIGTHTTQNYTHFIKFCKALSLEPVARYEGALRHRGRLLARIITTCINHGFYPAMGLIHQWELTAHSGYQNDTNFIKFCKIPIPRNIIYLVYFVSLLKKLGCYDDAPLCYI